MPAAWLCCSPHVTPQPRVTLQAHHHHAHSAWFATISALPPAARRVRKVAAPHNRPFPGKRAPTDPAWFSLPLPACSRIAPNLQESIPNLEEVTLTGNLVAELGDITPLQTLPKLVTLSLIENPVAKAIHYRKFVIHTLPGLKILDFHKIRQTVRAAKCRGARMPPLPCPPPRGASAGRRSSGSCRRPRWANGTGGAAVAPGHRASLSPTPTPTPVARLRPRSLPGQIPEGAGQTPGHAWGVARRSVQGAVVG